VEKECLEAQGKNKMEEKIKNLISIALKNLGIEVGEILLEHPIDLNMGDYSTNVAMALAKGEKENPRELAEKIVDELNKKLPEEVTKTEAKNGFINFYLSPKFFAENIEEILKERENFGKNSYYSGKKMMVEYTDPNPFKEFHIGHLMSNTIGESISRIIAASGAEVKRACYQGDIGLHVAKTVWAMKRSKEWPKDLSISFLGRMYALGAKAYTENEGDKKEIEEINKQIYGKDSEVYEKYYLPGREISLDYFETIYRRLGTKFDFYFFESETGELGKEIVEKNIGDVFEKSEGAIVFKGENFHPSLHTRVFVNKEGLPTYEAKELGLAKIKYDKYPYTNSIVITGNEVNDYFRVLLEAMEHVFPDLAEKTKHLSHGMLRLPTGKMSSRTGEVITAESLLEIVSKKVVEKVKETNRSAVDASFINQVAVSALKYSILKQSIGGDIIFDFDKSISFEGNSGPYLQYSYARAKSILEKAKAEGIFPSLSSSSPASLAQGFAFRSPDARSGTVPAQSSKPAPGNTPSTLLDIERLLYRFPEVVLRSAKEFEPHYLVNYLTELARAFNAFYGNTKIVDKEDPTSLYKVALTEAFSIIMKNGLSLLGIETPEKM
jgi:arginyl-tRNA synthetase